MIVGAIRSGLVEMVHPVAAAAVDRAGNVLALSGDAAGREFFLRSAVKPIQAAVCQASGADLGIERLAVAAASHQAFPAHVALVEGMLSEMGLTSDNLVCPPDHPGSGDAEQLWAGLGRSAPERVFHNCSGKHAAMLRACVHQGWPLQYQLPDHPLQRLILSAVEEATGRPAAPTGVDGCGIPTLRSDAVGLARAFSHVAADSEFGEVRDAAMRYTALTRDGDRPEVEVTRWLPVLAKVGAAGCIGIAWPEGGLGFAAKAWSGDGQAALLGALTLMAELGIVPEHPREQLTAVFSPQVLGGGRPVGQLAVIER